MTLTVENDGTIGTEKFFITVNGYITEPNLDICVMSKNLITIFGDGIRGRYLGGIWAVFGRYLGGIWAIFGRYLGSIWAVFGRYLGGIWAVVGRYLGGI